MIEKQKSTKLNWRINSVDSEWIRIISEINRIKPKYGNLELELKFHNSNLVKASISNRTDTLLFKKEENDEKN
jgi:hypothetical protein